jgi:hypothetical protein
MAKKALCGFVSADLSQSTLLKASNEKGFSDLECGENAGIFLISNNALSSKPKPKPKATSNRKYISFSETYNHNGVDYMVNSEPTGIYTYMMSRIIKQLDTAQKLWGRVLVVRIDLHQSEYTEDSKTVSWFFKHMVAKLKKRYHFDQVGYIWVREHERAKAQHYHCWFFLDGRKIKHSSKVITMAKETWVKNWAGNHHIPTTKKPFRLIGSEEVKHEVIYWLSYACKGRGKGYRPPQSKDYGTSRLKIK